MHLLLDNQFAPTTWTMGFLEAPLKNVIETYLEWHRPLQEKRGVAMDAIQMYGGLRVALSSLLPLTTHQRRRCVLIQAASPWVAYFDNGARGSDPLGYVSHMAILLKCRGVLATYVPELTTMNTYGSRQWEIYGAHQTDWLNNERSLAASNDGGRWVFVDRGTKLPFENCSMYSKKVIKDRFTGELLCQYLKAMGIDAFNEDFYRASEGFSLIEQRGPCAQNLRAYSLEEAQARFSKEASR